MFSTDTKPPYRRAFDPTAPYPAPATRAPCETGAADTPTARGASSGAPVPSWACRSPERGGDESARPRKPAPAPDLCDLPPQRERSARALRQLLRDVETLVGARPATHADLFGPWLDRVRPRASVRRMPAPRTARTRWLRSLPPRRAHLSSSRGRWLPMLAGAAICRGSGRGMTARPRHRGQKQRRQQEYRRRFARRIRRCRIYARNRPSQAGPPP